jgi:hypothetical protein
MKVIALDVVGTPTRTPIRSIRNEGEVIAELNGNEITRKVTHVGELC